MRKVMKTLILVAITCAFLAAPAFAGMTVTTTGGGGYGVWQTGQGGEFTLQPVGWNPVPLYYVSSTSGQGGTGNTFQTFCVEEQEYVYPNTTFDVKLNADAVMGGTGSSDPISRGTAWLYHEFQSGTLTGYEYGNGGVGRHQSAQDLQNAIWYLEGEGGSLTAAYTAKLVGQFGSIAKAMEDNNGYPVMALNLYAEGHLGDPRYLRQDMLVCVPLPASVLLVVFAVGAAGRKLRQFV
jgi:hypothetical protein